LERYIRISSGLWSPMIRAIRSLCTWAAMGLVFRGLLAQLSKPVMTRRALSGLKAWRHFTAGLSILSRVMMKPMLPVRRCIPVW